MIYYIQPYRIDRNLGKGINDAITQLQANNEDWIVLTDHDAMFLLPDSKAHIEAILANTNYDILGPVTNRLGIPYQLVNGMFDETNITNHIQMAKRCWEQNGYSVIECRDYLAAFCLCFRVSTWKQLGGFAENSLQFDIIFCLNAHSSGLKLGIMTGIYLFHLYRLGSNIADITHLLPAESVPTT